MWRTLYINLIQPYLFFFIILVLPCFPASNGTGVHHCDNALNRSLPSHDTKGCPSNTSQDSTRPTTNDLCHCLENHEGYIIWEIVIGRNAHVAVYLRMINQFQECFYVSYVNNSQYTFYMRIYQWTYIILSYKIKTRQSKKKF